MNGKLSVFSFIILLAGESMSHATPGFPDAMRQNLGVANSPLCSICHGGGVTGRGTVTTPFGQAMLARGLSPGDNASLAAALAQMESDQVDSNNNSIPDVEELRLGQDPNWDANHPQVTYGCAVGAAPRHRDLFIFIFFLVAILLYLSRRRCRLTTDHKLSRRRDLDGRLGAGTGFVG